MPRIQTLDVYIWNKPSSDLEQTGPYSQYEALVKHNSPESQAKPKLPGSTVHPGRQPLSSVAQAVAWCETHWAVLLKRWLMNQACSSRAESLLTCTRSRVLFPVPPEAKQQNGDGTGGGACTWAKYIVFLWRFMEITNLMESRIYYLYNYLQELILEMNVLACLWRLFQAKLVEVEWPVLNVG